MAAVMKTLDTREPKGANPQRVSTEIIIEITQFKGITCLYRKYIVYPLKDSFSIENGLGDKEIRVMGKKSSKYIENKCSH